MLEVGPGRGALTVHLAGIARRVVAVELDRGLAAELPARCGHPPNLEVVGGDILRIDLEQVFGGADAENSVVAGSLPYYITSPILRAVFAVSRSIRSATFLIQEDVADRTVAVPGRKSFGFLSCLCQLYSRPAKLFTVAPGAFSPRPRVTSAVVHFKMRQQAPPEGLLRFLGACFRSPRKTLKNNLSGRYSPRTLAADPSAAMRAQQLAVEDLASMWSRLESHRRERNAGIPR